MLSCQKLSLLALIVATAPACLVAQSTYDTCLADLAKTRSSLSQAQTRGDGLQGERDALDTKLVTAVSQNKELVTKLTAMGENVGHLLGEKDQLAHEREDLSRQVSELSRLRSQAEQREREYRLLLSKLRSMIDAGTLQVHIRDGRMLVQMSTDLLFPPGGTRLKPPAQAAIVELSQTLKTFADRRFQVVGHSDSTPINTARFPSNWELSAQRAIEVAKVMVDSGVQANMISAAGNAEFDPLKPNDSPGNKALNRRVELVFLPKIEELPGFSEALETPQQTPPK